MGTTAKKPEDMTWADIKATLAEATLLSKENQIESKKNRIARKKFDEELKELEKTVNNTSKSVDKLTKAVFGMNQEINGISKSNGMVAEDYFYESLKESKTFGGVHFDEVGQDVGGIVKLKDGTRHRGQFDIVLVNDTAVCIIEVKYRLRKEDVLEVVNKDVDSFKKLFPVYEGYKFYLAVGGMTIEDQAMDAAKQHGVGVVKLMGGKVEIFDKNLKVY